jgi:hypothetical protein
MVAMSRRRPPQRAQHNTSNSNARAISWAHVQFRRSEGVAVARSPRPSGAALTSTAAANTSGGEPTLAE